MHLLLDRLAGLPTRSLALFILLLCLPAYLIHLGYVPFIDDESIRAQVALEMQLSGNYIATTLHGEPYINKPPLFNWILLLGFRAFNWFGELPARLVNVLALGAYAACVYGAVRRRFPFGTAFLAALLVITSGRFLFYDAMLGLIDTTFSLVTYALFMALYFNGERGRWRRLFLVSYLLMAIGFLLKGFPALVFQGLSLPAALLFFRQGRRFFSWDHVLGIGAAGLVLAAYFGAYAWFESPERLVSNLMHESVKRTAVQFGWWRTVQHLFTFPFEWIYHFLPYSLLAVFWVDRRLRARLQENRFVLFNFVLLAVNLPVYWASVEVMPRYLLMFLPLFMTIGLYLMENNRTSRTWRFRLFFVLLGIMLVASVLIFFPLPLLDRLRPVAGLLPISLILTAALGLIAALYFYNRDRFLWWFVIGLLLIRTGFNLIVLPVRVVEAPEQRTKENVYRLADRYRDRTWWVYGDAKMKEFVSFYLTQRLGYIVRRTTETDRPRSIFVVNTVTYPDFRGQPLDTLYSDRNTINLMLYETGQSE